MTDLNQKQRPNDKFTPQQVIDALAASAGVHLRAAEKLNCALSTIAYYVARYPEVAEAKREISDAFIDLAESKLVESVRGGNLTAVIFTLKTRGKHRGYTERQEVTGPGGAAISVAPDLSMFSDDELRAARDLHRRARERQSASGGGSGGHRDGAG